MDDIMYRTRNPRQPVQSRRRTKRLKRAGLRKDSRSITGKILFQTAVCTIILALIGLVKSVDTPVTNSVQEKLKNTFAYTIKIKDLTSMAGKILPSKEETLAEEENKESYEDKMTLVEKEPEDNQVLNSVDIKATDVPEYEADIPEEDTAEEDNNMYKFIIPVGGVIGSFFGERVHPIKGNTEFHKGIDIEAQNGTAIKAAYDGEVVEAGEEATFGKYIKIKHDESITSLYAHCSSLNKKKGEKVNKGDIIAKVGSTGLSQGPHLHFEIWKDEEAVNPLDYIGRLPD